MAGAQTQQGNGDADWDFNLSDVSPVTQWSCCCQVAYWEACSVSKESSSASGLVRAAVQVSGLWHHEAKRGWATRLQH